MKEQLVIKEGCKKRFLPVVNGTDRLLLSAKSPIIVAVDGMSASGKTTLSYYLKEVFDCNIFHMDDFFLQNYQRTEERMKEVGGNVDYERFKAEVLEPLQEKRDVIYRPYRCDIGKIEEETVIPFKRLNIVEGSYSQHPYFGKIYDLKVFTKIGQDSQTERIRKRNGEQMLERFVTEWIPKEHDYFEKFQIEKDSLVINNDRN